MLHKLQNFVITTTTIRCAYMRACVWGGLVYLWLWVQLCAGGNGVSYACKHVCVWGGAYHVWCGIGSEDGQHTEVQVSEVHKL